MSIKESKKMNIDELDGVAGGTIIETVADSVELYKRGLLNSEYDSCAAVRNKLHGQTLIRRTIRRLFVAVNWIR